MSVVVTVVVIVTITVVAVLRRECVMPCDGYVAGLALRG